MTDLTYKQLLAQRATMYADDVRVPAPTPPHGALSTSTLHALYAVDGPTYSSSSQLEALQRQASNDRTSATTTFLARFAHDVSSIRTADPLQFAKQLLHEVGRDERPLVFGVLLIIIGLASLALRRVDAS